MGLLRLVTAAGVQQRDGAPVLHVPAEAVVGVRGGQVEDLVPALRVRRRERSDPLRKAVGGVAGGDCACELQSFGGGSRGDQRPRLQRVEKGRVEVVSASLEGTTLPEPGWGVKLESITLPVGYLERLTILVEVLVMGAWGIEEIYQWLFDCADLADHIACQGTYASDPTCNNAGAPAAQAIEAACTQLQQSTLGRFTELAEMATGITAESRIATPPGEACLIVTGEETQALGSLSSHCTLEIDIHQDQTVVNSRPGTWYATGQ